jgi:hypothetical protein
VFDSKGPKEIPLTRGKVARVSDEDFKYLMQWNWFAYKSNDGQRWYAIRRTSRKLGKRKTIYMHDEIMPPPPGMLVDHRDHDGLNNQRSNLRHATCAQNVHNSNKQKNNKSGYIGVRYRRGRFEANISLNRRAKFLGSFACAEDAARTYDKAAKETRGEFAVLNFPDE